MGLTLHLVSFVGHETGRKLISQIIKITKVNAS